MSSPQGRKAYFLCTLLVIVFNYAATCSSANPLDLLSASTSKLVISVDAIAVPQTTPRRHFLIISDNDSVKTPDVIFQENALLLTRALQKQGFVQAADQESADVAIHLRYVTSKPGSISSDNENLHAKVAAVTNLVTIRAVDLVEYRRSGAQLSPWQLNITAEFMIGDIEMVFPYTVVASLKYVEKNTAHTERFLMDVDDPKVEKLISSAFPKKRK